MRWMKNFLFFWRNFFVVFNRFRVFRFFTDRVFGKGQFQCEVEHDKVSIGCSIRLYDEEFEEEITYKLVGSTEANILENKISNESPIGKALIGKMAGDVVEVEGIEGTCEFKILEVYRD